MSTLPHELPEAVSLQQFENAVDVIKQFSYVLEEQKSPVLLAMRHHIETALKEMTDGAPISFASTQLEIQKLPDGTMRTSLTESVRALGIFLNQLTHTRDGIRHQIAATLGIIIS